MKTAARLIQVSLSSSTSSEYQETEQENMESVWRMLKFEEEEKFSTFTSFM